MTKDKEMLLKIFTVIEATFEYTSKVQLTFGAKASPFQTEINGLVSAIKLDLEKGEIPEEKINTLCLLIEAEKLKRMSEFPSGGIITGSPHSDDSGEYVISRS